MYDAGRSNRIPEKTEGYDLFHIEDRPTRSSLLDAEMNHEANGTSLRTGNCLNAPDMMALSINGMNRQDIEEKLNSIREKEE